MAYRYCECCGYTTHHTKRSDDMPSLWIPALLTVVTFGAFFPVYVLYMALTWGRIAGVFLECDRCHNQIDLDY